MKKILIIGFVVMLLIIGYSHDQFLWCKKLLSNDPTTYTIKKGEYLSEIAKKYYGRADYWRELALINRSPNSNLVFPGETIIIPSLNVIKEIRKTRWLSKVNAYIEGQQDILAQLNKGKEPVLTENPAEKTLKPTPETGKVATTSELEPMTTQPGSEPAPVESKEADVQKASSSSLPLILAIIGLIFIASLVAFILYSGKKRSQKVTIVDKKDFKLSDGDEESEPDYQEYLRNKSKRKKGVLVS